MYPKDIIPMVAISTKHSDAIELGLGLRPVYSSDTTQLDVELSWVVSL